MNVEVLKIPFGDGVSALDRAMRAITMIADGALGRLHDLGWTRKTVNLEVDPDDPLPCWVCVKKKRVFEIVAMKLDDGRVQIQGNWLCDPPKPSIIDRLWGI